MFPRPAGCVFSLGRKSSSSNRSNRRVLCLILQMVQKLKTITRSSSSCSTVAGTARIAATAAQRTPAPPPTAVAASLIVQTMVQKVVENYCFFRVSDWTLGTFWARVWRCSVLQGHCVSLSGRVRFEPPEEEQQQQEQQEGCMSHCTNSGIKIGRKL